MKQERIKKNKKRVHSGYSNRDKWYPIQEFSALDIFIAEYPG